MRLTVNRTAAKEAKAEDSSPAGMNRQPEPPTASEKSHDLLRGDRLGFEGMGPAVRRSEQADPSSDSIGTFRCRAVLRNSKGKNIEKECRTPPG